MQSKIAELLHQYFELGVAEGREGRNHDTEAGDAQRVLSEIEAEIAALSAAKPVGYQLVFSDGRTSRVLYSKDEADRFKKASDITVDIRALYAAPPAPSVAVKAKLIAELREMAGSITYAEEPSRVMREAADALSAQVQDVARWQDISTLEPKDGMIVMGWGEYRERDGFSPAFMRWYDSVGGWSVSAMPFYPTHWMPLPAAPAKQEG